MLRANLRVSASVSYASSSGISPESTPLAANADGFFMLECCRPADSSIPVNSAGEES